MEKKTTILSNCEYIKEYLSITGTPLEAYELKNSTSELEFIKTEHSHYLDAYGVKLKINNKFILYTGDTSTLEPYKPYFNKISELYIDVSTSGEAHIKINDVLTELKKLKEKNVNIFLMHLDNKKLISDITNNEFYLD